MPEQSEHLWPGETVDNSDNDDAQRQNAVKTSQGAPRPVLSVVDAVALTVAAEVPVGLGAHGVTVSPDGTVFVSNIHDGTVSVVEPASRSVVRTVPVGAGPNGITYRSASASDS